MLERSLRIPIGYMLYSHQGKDDYELSQDTLKVAVGHSCFSVLAHG